MGEHHAFWLAGRARGVDDRRKIIGLDLRKQFVKDAVASRKLLAARDHFIERRCVSYIVRSVVDVGVEEYYMLDALDAANCLGRMFIQLAARDEKIIFDPEFSRIYRI